MCGRPAVPSTRAMPSDRKSILLGTEGVASEVGELQEQLAGPVGVGTHEAGDGAEGVVDEVRADLCSECSDLGLHEASAGGVELGQVELAGDPGGDLVTGAQRRGRGPGDQGDQGADRVVIDEQRRHHRRGDLAVGPLTRQVAAPGDLGDVFCGDPVEEHSELVEVVGALALVGQELLGVDECDSVYAEQRAQVLHAALGCLAGEAEPQAGCCQGGGVQRAEGRPVGLTAEMPSPDPPPHGLTVVR